MNQTNLFQNSKLLRTCLVMIVITLSVYWLVILRTFLVPILVSILLSILVSPITLQLEDKGLKRMPAIAFTLILFLGLIAGILYVSYIQISDMIDMWPSFLNKADFMFYQSKTWMSETFGFETRSQLDDLENMSAQLIQDNGSTAILMTTAFLATLALIPLYMFFMLYYRTFFCEFLYGLLGKAEKKRINLILFRIYDVIHNYLAGMFTVMVIVGSLNTIGLLILGIKYAVFFGFFASLLLLIPYIGVIIGSALPIMMALVTKESPMYAVGVGAVFFTIQLLEGNFITPYIVGSKISINPLMAILALLLGGMLWGIPGMILALPMVAILKVILDHSEDLKAFGYVLGDPDSQKGVDIFEVAEEEEIENASGRSKNTAQEEKITVRLEEQTTH
jgi:predicted PurR-regulated permease PerM